MNSRAIRDEMLRSLDYEADTGVFTWKRKVNSRAPAGSEAGFVQRNGYRRIGLCGKQWSAHRLAWLYVHGEWPRGHIDHINGNTSDNRIANLRDVSRSVNQQNQRRAHSTNRLGVLGVIRDGNGFRTQISVGGRQKHIGTFGTAEEAHAAYVDAKRKHHEGCSL